jgi:exodeoxyribonuclease VII large subunit
VKRLIGADPILHMVQVAGEVSNCTYHGSGHVYFSLKDENSRIRCVMFRSQAQGLKIRLKEGMRVMAAGSVTVYERDGQYQLVVSHVEETGLGDWFLAFQQLKEKLEAEGLLDAARKKPLPRYPETIGLITSETGAALQDFLTVLQRRWPSAKLTLFPVVVQGELAPASLTRAVKKAQEYPLDLILLGRGGGSIEELWGFNSESLAYAIAESTIPIITGIGHETDFTIADFVADQRANTPTAAAELAVPDGAMLTRQLDGLLMTIRHRVETHLRQEKRSLNALSLRAPFRFPTRFVDERLQALDGIQTQLVSRIRQDFRERQSSLDHAGEKLHQLSPLSILGRGYAMVQDEADGIVTRTEQVTPGMHVKVRLQDGGFRAQVTERIKGAAHDEEEVL